VSLKDEILAAFPGLTPSERDDGVIAEQLSIGRKKLETVEVGNGLILATIGMTSGNSLLDVINSAPDFRHVKPLLEQGRLTVNSPLVRAAIDNLVGVCITQGEADAIKALAETPDPVTPQQVSKALEGYF